MKVVYAKEDHPTEVVKSIFLAGPTPRDTEIPSWRPGALKILEGLGFDGHVFVPEPRDGKVFGDDVDQVEWEEKALHQADVIVFWVPRDLKTMLALTTNVEWGLWADTGKAVLGTPPDAQRVRYLQHMATKLKVANYSTLDATLEDAVKSLGDGSLRVGGESQVPLLVWKHPTFQRWYKSQTAAGNRLDSARVLWTFRVGQQLDKVFFWCLHVGMWVTAEQRAKTNEFVLSRTDLSYCVAHRGDQVVLVREFRSPVRNEAGFVYELAGGSSHNPQEDPLNVISHEVEEETGLRIDSDRFIQHETRQLVATLGAHVANLFSVELTQEEIDQLKSDVGTVHGVIEDTEQTYVEVWSLKDILARQLVDWTTLGMILSVVGLG